MAPALEVIFSRSMATEDSVEKVCEYYQRILDSNKLSYRLGNDKHFIEADGGGCGILITGKGGYGGGGTATQAETSRRKSE